jgi:guanylate kinase
LLPRFGALALAISATTRPVRPGEVDGEDYYFLTPDQFAARVAEGDFLEHVAYAGNAYGTLRSEVERLVGEGCWVVVEIELRGARAIRAMVPDAVTIFIAPPSPEALAERLRRRGKDSEAAIARRLEESVIELAAQGEFDHVVVNDDAERAADELETVVARYLHGSD